MLVSNWMGYSAAAITNNEQCFVHKIAKPIASLTSFILFYVSSYFFFILQLIFSPFHASLEISIEIARHKTATIKLIKLKVRWLMAMARRRW